SSGPRSCRCAKAATSRSAPSGRCDVPCGLVEPLQARVAEVFRLEYARVVSSVARIVRDLDAAEEVVQEAFALALEHWPQSGIPARPGAWLLTAARRRALDRLRRARRADAHAGALAREIEAGVKPFEVSDPATT